MSAVKRDPGDGCGFVVTHDGREWGFFTSEDLAEMGMRPTDRNVRWQA